MADEIGAIEKAFKVLNFIVNKNKFTAKEIADELECSIRNARRYVKSLRYLFKNQIVNEKKGVYKWKTIDKIDDRIKKSPFFRVILALMEIGKAINPDKSYWHDLEKIFSSVNYGDKGINLILFEKVISYEKIRKTKELIERAIKGRKIVKFKYLKNEKFYRLAPYRVILDKGIWYVAGIDEKDNRLKTFSLDLIKNAEIEMDSAFVLDEKILVQIRDEQSIWQISSDEIEEDVIIEVKQDIGKYFKRKKYFSKQEIIEEMKNGNLKIKFIVKNEYDFKMQVFNWMPYFRVLEPEKYVKLYLELLEESLEFQRNI